MTKLKNITGIFLKRWYVILILLVIGGFVWYQNNSAFVLKTKKQIYTIKRQDLAETLSLSGEIEADERVVLRFQTSGKLIWVGAKEGDYVKKYQGIASLDQRELKKKMDKSLNTYLKTRYDFDQSKDDNNWTEQSNRMRGDEMKRLFDKAQLDLNSSVIDVELNDLAKEYAYLYSPIEGILVRADIKYPGVNITPAGAEYEIINPNTIYFSFTADQTDIMKLHEGMTGEMIFDSYPDSVIKGNIYYLSYLPKTGETGTVYEGRIKIPADKVMQYRFGMTGDVQFEMSRKNNIVTVPAAYVKSDSKGKYVEKILDEKTLKKEKTYIKVDEDIDGVYEVLGGLEANDKIFISDK